MMKGLKRGLLAVLLCICGAVFALGAVACGKKSDTPAKDPNICTVTFELCTPEGLTTNVVAPKEVKKGNTVTKPIVAVLSDNPNNAEVDAWYTDKEYTKKWSFLVNKVESDMTLYAKWVNNHTVTYYLGLDATTPMFEEQYRDGAPLKIMTELSDGYKCNGFFYEDGTEVVDGVPVNGPLNIYIDRSEEMYFSASMIANRFTPVAAGGAGSTAGTLTLEGEGEDAYVKANFGYSTFGDPYMHLKNVTLDITGSQKLRVTFKNLGKATSLKFYFVIWYEDGTPVSQNYFTEETTYTYYYKADQIEMSADDEWAVAEFDIAGQNVLNGVSLWGNATTLVQLRMQSGYVSENKEDLSNEVWIKSIEGIKDLTNVGTDDTEEVQALQKDDAQADLDAVSATQEDVSGWVFPKNFADASVLTKTDEEGNEIAPQVAIYNKTNGLLMRSEYRAKETSVVLTVPEGKTICLDDLTTIRLRLKNLGYADTLTLKYETDTGRMGSREVAIDMRMSETQEYVVNMFNTGNKYSSNLVSLTITYSSIGNDNAILLESVIFDEFIPLQISGFNFNDKTAFGIESTDTLKAAYDKGEDATKFTVLESGASFEKTFDCYSVLGYEGLELQYVLEEEYENENGEDVANGITKAIVELTVDGVAYAHEFALATGRSKQTVALPLKASGYVEKLKVNFEGVGVIYLQELRFSLDVNSSVDFGSSSVFSMMLPDWKSTLAYNSDLSAVLYVPKYNAQGHQHGFNWYIGYKMNETGVPNIPLADKDKLVIIYQNRGEGGYINLGIGHVDDRMPEYAETYQTDYRYAGGSGGVFDLTGLKTNMAEDEWAAAEFDLKELHTAGQSSLKVTAEDLAHLHLSTLAITPSVSMYIRAVIITKADGNVVSFDVNAPEGVVADGVEDKFVRAGEKLSKPTVNVTENSTDMQIIGWYTDEACTQAWDFNNAVTEEMTLYAKWGVSHTVNFYLDGALIDTQYYENGTAFAPEISVLGHKLLGYEDANGNAVAVGDAVTADMEITVKRSENLYFDANAIKANFVPVASNAGSDGSTAGWITVKGEEDAQYAEVNFGYTKEIQDAHIIINNVNVDITASQKLKITFKNLGGAKTLKFYFIVCDQNGNAIGQATINETAAYRYDFTGDEINMNEAESWIVKEFDLSSVKLNGISLWGTAYTLRALRIQSQYVSNNPNDLSNVLLIKSIEGVADESYTTTDDTFAEGFLANDNVADVENAASQQTAINGFIFPKDNALATANGVTLYNKVNGLLLSSAYMGAGSVTFTVEEGKTINLDELTTLAFNLQNYGYATKLLVSWETMEGVIGSRELTVSASMTEVKTFALNMAGYTGYEGTLKSLTVAYTSVGNDNAVLFDSIEFKEFQAETLVGFNFNDRKTFGLVSSDDLGVAYDGLNEGTKFTVNTNGASAEKTIDYAYTLLGYTKMTLAYAMATEGVTAVNVTLTVGGKATTYTYNVAVSDGVAKLTQEIAANANVEKVVISFAGVGEITVCALTFDIGNGLDFSVADPFENGSEDWMDSAIYDEDMKAANKMKAGTFKFYLGASYAWYQFGEGCVSLEGKSKIVIIYQNRGAAASISTGIGITSTKSAGWQGAIVEGGTGGYVMVNYQGNMAENEWAATTIDITTLPTNLITEANKADWAFGNITMVTDSTFYIRAITVI
ncbi:MAG: InlB B-repeat-containing protein [Clostridia bacterium]|nr:InlB B-repeat-containing protein [Clostridia bacterium]